MRWREVSTVSVGHGLAPMASQEGARVREPRRRYGISPTTG